MKFQVMGTKSLICEFSRSLSTYFDPTVESKFQAANVAIVKI